LFDAGEVNRQSNSNKKTFLKTSPPLPNDSISAGRCIINYISHVMPGIRKIDYAVISHFHPDHYGSIHSNSKWSSFGKYQLSGITEVNEYLPIQTLIDRNYPDYNFPVDIKANTFEKENFLNYIKFTESLSKNSLVQSLKPGGKSQIKLRNNSYPEFLVRNICANGEAWTGKEEKSKKIIPSTVSSKDYNENPLSIALKISYGKFDYFTGGDLTGLSGFGLPSWFDMESEIAPVTGPVDVLSLNHHGVRDATNETFLNTLSPQVIVQQSWSSNHPGEEVLHRMISPSLPKDKRDIFATYIHPETMATYGFWLVDNYKSTRGHIALRVSPGGTDFLIYILDDTKLNLEVKGKFGPYVSR
jgi:beta-lactamase superfamily II metal-dependent hydrolase